MRMIYLLIIFLALQLNYLQAQPIETNCEGFSNAEFTLLSYKESQEYINKYATFHSANQETHTRAYYLSSKAILFLDSFFTIKNNYKGFNIHFVVYNTKPNSEQGDLNQALLYIAPVLNIPNDTANKRSDPDALKAFFNSLVNNQFFNSDLINRGLACPGNCDDSLMSWGGDGVGYFRFAKELPDSKNSDKILFSTKSFQGANKKNYKAYHGKEFGGDQTLSVYFGKETVRRLKYFIRDGNNLTLFPIVGIYFGSYDKLVDSERTHQRHPRQTTLGFAPLRKIQQYFEPDICSYINFIKGHAEIYGIKAVKGSGKFKFSENHGELCPDDCPQQGF